jgi:hypothetical protein
VKSTVLSPDDEAVIVAFRKHTLLPLDDCLYALQPTITHLTRSSLHRCLQRHGISRLPQIEGDKPVHKAFKVYPIGYFHIDIAEVHSAEGRLYLFVAIDRTSKFAFVRLEESATVQTATAFLQELIDALPYRIHTVLTDNGIQFCDLPSRRNGPTARLRMHMFILVHGREGDSRVIVETVAKWRRRTSTADHPTGPRQVKSTVLSPDALMGAVPVVVVVPAVQGLRSLAPT